MRPEKQELGTLPEPANEEGCIRIDVDELYRRYGAELYRYALAVTGDAEAAKDIVQETMFGAWLRRDSFRGDSSVRTWLYGICRNKVRDHFRGVERRHEDRGFESQVTTAERDLPGLGGTVGQPKNRAVVSFEDELVERSSFWKAFRRLPVGHQEAILLVFYAGFSQAETGAILGIPVDTVRSRIYHARKQLARFLQDEDRQVGLQLDDEEGDGDGNDWRVRKRQRVPGLHKSR